MKVYAIVYYGRDDGQRVRCIYLKKEIAEHVLAEYLDEDEYSIDELEVIE